MMEHIRQFDWCSSQPDAGFVVENELDNCVTERILRNKYRDPLMSSDSESEAPVKINWDEVFKRKKNGDKFQRVYVPGLRPVPPFPKLSALSAHQQYQCLKVLCAENPQVLEAEFIPRPTKTDYRVFEEVQSTYLKEQKEFLDWAKSQWINHQCIRALRPKPLIETVYEAEFKMRTHQMKGYPKNYVLAAQIPLEARDSNYDLVCGKELISVNATELPTVYIPELIVKRFTVLRPCALPEPCAKHPCRLQLPNEKSVSILPVSEVHKELAQFALDNGVQVIASEAALTCLMELDRAWSLPLSVCEAIGPDGDKCNVLVLGSEFSPQKEAAPRRTYKAFRHLLQHVIVPPSEQAKWLKTAGSSPQRSSSAANNEYQELSSDDDNGSLVIDDGGPPEKESLSDTETVLEMDIDETEPNEDQTETKKDQTETNEDLIEPNEDQMEANTDQTKGKEDINKTKESPAKATVSPKATAKNAPQIGVYNCTCKDTIYERPPPRSFRIWQVRNLANNDRHDLIVHCAHKVRGNVGELLLEPIPEYQVELGGTKQSKDKLKSLALSLKLRRNASVLNVRVDSQSGDVLSFDKVFAEEIQDKHGPLLAPAAAAIHAALDQLRGLLPANYMLQHQAEHGSNALLYVCRARAAGGAPLAARPLEDEAAVRDPPALAPVLLPHHKYRKILPLAFTPHLSQVAKEPRKPVTRQKTPPQALKWPKRKKKAKSKN